MAVNLKVTPKFEIDPATDSMGRGWAGWDEMKEKLYVRLSRGRERLVVCGDPAVIRTTGGDAVVRCLQGG